MLQYNGFGQTQFTEKCMLIVSYIFVGAGIFAMAYPVALGIIGFAKSFASTTVGS